ncbi:MAG: hypothetical protein ACPGQL_02595 [Thermoplasmatota archaeon]
MAPGAGQERLWLTQPRRATCLTEVQEVQGDRFRVDRALFAPRSRACRHPQPADKGTVWVEGEKRRLAGVMDDPADGQVWYRLRGTVPDVGARLQCEIDAKTRNLASRAHTALHLWLLASPTDLPPLVADPEVRGGGHFRLTYAWTVAPAVLADQVKRCQAAIARDVPLEHRYVTRDEAKHLAYRQPFQPPDPLPGPDPLPLVGIGDVWLPCDGTHVDRTGRIGGIVVSHARGGREGFVVGGRVMEPRA